MLDQLLKKIGGAQRRRSLLWGFIILAIYLAGPFFYFLFLDWAEAEGISANLRYAFQFRYYIQSLLYIITPIAVFISVTVLIIRCTRSRLNNRLHTLFIVSLITLILTAFLYLIVRPDWFLIGPTFLAALLLLETSLACLSFFLIIIVFLFHKIDKLRLYLTSRMTTHTLCL